MTIFLLSQRMRKMTKLSSIGEGIPKIKASLPELAKFVLLALGWIVGRMIHVEIDKRYGGNDLISFPALLDGTKTYILSSADIMTGVALALMAFFLYKWGKILKWFGAGLFIYIVTFEVYEVLWGYVLTSVTPVLPQGGGQ